LKVIYDGLTSLGEAYVQFDQANLLSLKLYRQPTPPPLIRDYDVPILLVDPARLENIPWDITAHRILPFINGRSCARKISLEAEVEI
jgi:nitrogen permease regulator 2-like protein